MDAGKGKESMLHILCRTAIAEARWQAFREDSNKMAH